METFFFIISIPYQELQPIYERLFRCNITIFCNKFNVRSLHPINNKPAKSTSYCKFWDINNGLFVSRFSKRNFFFVRLSKRNLISSFYIEILIIHATLAAWSRSNGLFVSRLSTTHKRQQDSQNPKGE